MPIIFLVMFVVITALSGVLLICYLTKQFVVLSFFLVGLLVKVIKKLFGIPPKAPRKIGKIQRSLIDYFGKAGNLWGKANRLDYLVGVIWSLLFAILSVMFFAQNYGKSFWLWIKQFDANRSVSADGKILAHYTTPSQSLLVGLIILLALTLYWLVPWFTLTIRRCRSFGHAGLWFLMLIPFAGYVLTILCLFLPEKVHPQSQEEDWDSEESPQNNYGDYR